MSDTHSDIRAAGSAHHLVIDHAIAFVMNHPRHVNKIVELTNIYSASQRLSCERHGCVNTAGELCDTWLTLTLLPDTVCDA
jgi:hypothetical protein